MYCMPAYLSYLSTVCLSSYLQYILQHELYVCLSVFICLLVCLSSYLRTIHITVQYVLYVCLSVLFVYLSVCLPIYKHITVCTVCLLFFLFVYFSSYLQYILQYVLYVCLFVLFVYLSVCLPIYQSWARDNFLASRQRQRDNVI